MCDGSNGSCERRRSLGNALHWLVLPLPESNLSLTTIALHISAQSPPTPPGAQKAWLIITMTGSTQPESQPELVFCSLKHNPQQLKEWHPIVRTTKLYSELQCYPTATSQARELCASPTLLSCTPADLFNNQNQFPDPLFHPLKPEPGTERWQSTNSFPDAQGPKTTSTIPTAGKPNPVCHPMMVHD